MRTWVRKLTATAFAAFVVALLGLALGVFSPAQAGTVRPAAATPISTATTTTPITAGRVAETQQDIANVLAANGASSAYPAVNSAITPPLQSAVAANGGVANSDTLALPFHVTITCTITFPPLKITCNVSISLSPTSTTAPATPN